jgi:ABC-type Fe3+/spermidine/putrescine transport system ATPase subunit
MSDSTPLLCRRLVKKFAGRQVLNQLSLEIPHGSITAVLGPSGCGKTTFLRVLAGLEQLDSGDISWQGEVWTKLPLALRGVSLAMQQSVITPHWTVLDHWKFALSQQTLQHEDRAARLALYADMLELEPLRLRQASLLSGGEQQRVALGRALIRQARLLLLDEPLSQVDRPLRLRLQSRLKELLAAQRTTVLWVTHDIQEAAAVAEYLAVMVGGEIARFGRTADVLAQRVNGPAAEYLR